MQKEGDGRATGYGGVVLGVFQKFLSYLALYFPAAPAPEFLPQTDGRTTNGQEFLCLFLSSFY